MIKKEFIDKCAKYCKTNKHAEVLHAESVRKLNDNGSGKKKRVVVITNQFIAYFKELKDVKPDHFHYWRNVSSFDINDQTVIIKFEKDFQLRFIHPNIEEFKSIIIQFFLRTFSSEELGPLDLSHFPHPPIGVNGRGILSRFDTLFRMKNKDPKTPVREYFEKFLLQRSKYVNFDESLEIDDVLNCILEALRPLPYLQYISLPKIVDSNLLYDALAEFVSKNSELKMFALRNNVDSKSKGFFDALKNSPVSQLKGLAFEDVELSYEELNEIHDLSVARQFSSARFINCIHQPVLDSFSTNYLTNDIMDKLRYLSLDRTSGINLNILSKRIQSLSVLSLAHCELEISDVLEIFGNAQLENLRFLNLSGNLMNRATNVQIPQNLERLHVSNVTWGSGVLPKFLKYILSQTFSFGLKLNVSSAQGVTESDWEAISNTFDELDKYPLEELSWSYNKVSESLIQYLPKNTKLTTLFLTNCFDVEQDLKVYQTFCSQLPNMSALSNLVIKGSDGLELREQASELLEALKQVKTLNLLIIDGNKIKDDGVQEIKDLVAASNSISTVSFDSSYISSIDVLRELIEAGSARRRPLHISWPVHDLTRLLDANSINNDELDNLKKDITVLSTGRGNMTTDAQWLQNFNIALQQKQIASSQRNAKNIRGSVRIGRKANQASQSNESKKDQGRKVRAGSFRGLKRPSLLATEKSPTEEDTSLWFNEPFDMFFVDFNDEFPLFLTDDVNKYFEKNPLTGEESTDGKRHRHHSSKHSSHHHHHSNHHSSKHHSSHHHHSKNKDNNDESESQSQKVINDDNKNEDDEIDVKTREINLNDESNDDSEERRLEEKRKRRDREEREKLEKEAEEEREKEQNRLRRQKDREEREKLEKEEEKQREIENKRIDRERKRKEKELRDEDMEEKRERGKQVNDRKLGDLTAKTRDVSFQEEEESVPKERSPLLKELDALFDNIVELELIQPPKNMFLYVDPYGRPINESLSATFSEGSKLIDFDPEPIDLINIAPPHLSTEISARTKPQVKRAWPSEDDIDRSSLAIEDGELKLINIDELNSEEFPEFDDEVDEDEELEKIDTIVIHRREREDEGNDQFPQKRFPVFPLLNVDNGDENNDSKVLPIDWNFQFSQVSNLGNYKFYKDSVKPLRHLVNDLDEEIEKDQTE